ncbi:MAG: nodulation protein NfeD, partial [Candidatus Stahlbacteria bacterium]|nr:nodulation protein NfeD [Candidatus Stahlbacteria bacterium]
HISVAKLEGVIHPPAAEYVLRAIEQSEKDKSECLIIELDTPGGLDDAMREITKLILNAKIPVIVYVHPSGARCASAGVFILLSAHIAAMTPGTNVGAAHPVAMGQKIEGEMKDKVENDAVAYIKSIAKKRGKNVKWAEEAVRKSVSVTDEEALELGIIDIRANNLQELVDSLDGRSVATETDTLILHTKGSTTKSIESTFKERFFSKIANPTIAYILLMLGLWGIILEFSHPGATFPGVFGGISLILAFYSFHLLPINYAGVGLIILGFGLFILEAITPTYGPLSIGGVASLTLGSIMLVRVKAEFLQIDRIAIIIAVVLTGSFFVFVLYKIFSTMKRKPITGKRGLTGQIGVVREKIELNKEGKVFIVGEWWNAIADETIEVGEKVKIIAIEGLTMKVSKSVPTQNVSGIEHK